MKFSPNHLIWAIATTLFLGVPATIVAIKWEPNAAPVVVDPTPQPAPVPVVLTFTDQLRTEIVKLSPELQGYLADQFKALFDLCGLEWQPKDDGHLQEIITNSRKQVYGESYPHAIELAAVNTVLRMETEKRGLTRADGEAVPWNAEAWQKFFEDCREALP